MNMSDYGRRPGGRKFYYSERKPSPWDYSQRFLNGNGWFANECHPPMPQSTFAPSFVRGPNQAKKVVEVVTVSSDDDDNASVKEINFADDIILNTENPVEVINLSSESECDKVSLSVREETEKVKIHWNDIDSPPKWTKGMKKFYNRISHRLRHFCHDRIIRGLRSERSERDNWNILDCDVYPSRKKEVRCLLCKGAGHVRFNCPRRNLIVCHMCGNDGHKEMTCPFKMCLNCGAKMEVFTRMCNTCAFYSKNTCTICEMVGHREELCSNHWRQYHSVTRQDDPLCVTPSVPARKSCCNCGGSGHVYEECQELRWSQYTPVSSLVLRMPPSVEEVEVGEGMSLSRPPLSNLVDEYKGLSVEEVEGKEAFLRLSGPSQLIAAFKGALSNKRGVPAPSWQAPSLHAPSKKNAKKRGKNKKNRRSKHAAQ